MKGFIRKRENIILAVILIVAAMFRFSKLAYQSLWLDELHTMIESDPSKSWQELLFYLKCCDQHPPLHFIIEKFLFHVFGYTEFVARFLSAVAGTVSVLAMYLLGKEFLGKRLGYIAAILTTINYFNIFYSQEARDYIFVFLFTILSFLYLLRFIKNYDRRNALFYSLFTLLMLYSHYYGLFVLVAQIMIALFYFILEKEKIQFFKYYSLAGVIIGIGFSPWIPFLFVMSGIKSFWIPPISSSFATDFFYEYFGNSDLLKPILLLIFALYFIFVFNSTKDKKQEEIKNSPLVSSFVILSMWIFVVYFIPYLRSLYNVPMLFPRYTIVVLPAFLLMLSFGIELIYNKYIRYIILGIFCTLSLTDLLAVKKYYSSARKTQFRELTAYVASVDLGYSYPIIGQENTAWHQAYYMEKFNLMNSFRSYTSETSLDSLVNKKGPGGLNGFCLIGVHGQQKLSPEISARLFSSYTLREEKDFVDAWCQFYVFNNPLSNNEKLIDYSYFDPSKTFDLNKQKVVAIFNGNVISQPIKLTKGKYEVEITSKGTSLSGIYAHLTMFVNEKKVKDYFTTASFESNEGIFELDKDQTIEIKITLDNDSFDPTTNEDRNAFIHSILLKKKE